MLAGVQRYISLNIKGQTITYSNNWRVSRVHKTRFNKAINLTYINTRFTREQ